MLHCKGTEVSCPPLACIVVCLADDDKDYALHKSSHNFANTFIVPSTHLFSSLGYCNVLLT